MKSSLSPESEISILGEALAAIFDPFLDDTMSSLPPIPIYFGELDVKQNEFIDACRTHHEIHSQEKRSGYCEWDLVLTLGAYTKHEAHKLWFKFVFGKRGGLTETQNRELWRYYRADMYFYRIQGRSDNKPARDVLVFTKPKEFEAFIERLHSRFKTSGAEFVVRITNFQANPNESVAFVFSRYNQCAVIVQKDNAMIEEALALKFLSILFESIAPWVHKWYTDTNQERFFSTPPGAPLTRGDIEVKATQRDFYVAMEE